METLASVQDVQPTGSHKPSFAGRCELGPPGRAPAHFRILVIDQGESAEMARQLAGLNCEVAVAETIKDAIGQHGMDLSSKFALMVAGFGGQSSAGDVAALVRSYASHDVPLVAASSNKDIGETCLEAGASDFLAKPFSDEGVKSLWKHAGGLAGGPCAKVLGQPDEASGMSESEDGCTESLGLEHPLLGKFQLRPQGTQPSTPAYKAQRSQSQDSCTSEQSGGLPGLPNTYAILQATYHRCGGRDAPAVTSLRRTDGGSSAFRSFASDPGTPSGGSSALESPADSDASSSWASDPGAHPNAALISQAVASDAAAMEFYKRTLAALGMQPPAAAKAGGARGGDVSPSSSEGTKNELGHAGEGADCADSAARGGDPQQDHTAKILSALDAKERRRIAVEKFRKKRKERNFDKKVRYESRKRLADQRPRVRGQFVKISDQGAAGAKE